MTTTGGAGAGALRVEGAGRTTSGSEPLPELAPSLGALLSTRIAATPDREAFRAPRDGGWKSWTWAEAGELVHDLAAGLLSLGLEPEQRVAIACGTSVEWIAVDLAITVRGRRHDDGRTPRRTRPTSRTSSPTRDRRSSVVEDAAQLGKLLAHRDELAAVRKVVLVSPTASTSAQARPVAAHARGAGRRRPRAPVEPALGRRRMR